MPDTSTSAHGSISAAIAAANALLPKPSDGALRFPAEDAGRSLAEIAHSDLDAALQLLAERAQYITRATGAAIALRRGERDDMQCRGSAGSNAPELGALLSMEYGLSGESVRTRQLLRCDDAQRDPRVNSDLCQELGIASVVVLPIVSDDTVLGVFELLSDKPRAFDERDLSALLRLGEMVETAVKQSLPAKIVPAVPQTTLPPSQPRVEVSPATADEDFVIGTLVVENKLVENKVVENRIPAKIAAENKVPANKVPEIKSPQPELRARPISLVPTPPAPLPESEVAPRKPEASAAAPGKPLFWSAAIRAQSAGPARENTDTLAVPPVLRNLQKCEACGFPVSQGRTFCVECEEKQWRGERITQPEIKSQPVQPPLSVSRAPAAPEAAQNTLVPSSSSDQATVHSSPAIAELKSTAAAAAAAPVLSQTPPDAISDPAQSAAIEEIVVPQPSETSSSTVPSDPAQVQVVARVQAEAENFTLFASAAQHDSWFAFNKYILGALLVVAIVIGVIAWLR